MFQLLNTEAGLLYQQIPQNIKPVGIFWLQWPNPQTQFSVIYNFWSVYGFAGRVVVYLAYLLEVNVDKIGS